MTITPGTRQSREPARRVPADPAAHPRRIPHPTAARGYVVLAAAASGWGIGAATLTPRGPLTSTHAFISVLVSLAVGLIAGACTRSRLAVLWAPLVFVVALELTRLDLVGPTVDAPFSGTYGLIALLGRGVHTVFSVVPIALGAALGAAARRGPRGSRPARWLGRAGASITGAAVLAACAAVVPAGRTAQLLGPDGLPLPGSIAELTRVPAGDHDLGLMLRGRDSGAPVLLFLAGGPGGSELGAMRNDTGLEQHFVVATLDQRGAGTSYDQLDPTESLTLQSTVDDAIATAEHLQRRFGTGRIIVTGQSFGSLVSVLAAQRRPDLFSAVVGTGQMVSVLATDRIMYADKLAWADRTGQSELATQLRRIGPPPYADLTGYELAVAGERDVSPYDSTGNAEGPGGFSEHVFAAEYNPLQRLHNLPAFLDTFAVLYPQLQQLDLRRDVPRLEVPVLLVQGRFEPRGRADLAREWYSRLRAPRKAWVELGSSGHRPIFEQPTAFVDALVRHVLTPPAAPEPAQ